MDTLTTLSAEAANFYDKDLLIRAEAAQVFYEAGQKRNLPKNSGNTIRWRRFNALTAITSTLTEGVVPNATALSQTEVTATVGQYGAYVEVSDLLDMMGIDPVISESVEVLGQHGGESVESVIRDVIKAGTSVQYVTGSTRTAQAITNILTVAVIRKGIRTLDANNARRFSGPVQNKKVGVGHYIGFVHPNVVYDLLNDSEWKALQQNSAPEKLYNGEWDFVMGVRWIQTTLAPIFGSGGVSSADVYGTLIIGQEAFGVVDVAGTGKFKTEVKQLGSAGAADPLNQKGTVGWKSQFVSKILNDNFIVRLESGCTGQSGN